MEYLGIEKFGVFTVGGVIPPLTDRPWFSNNYPGQLSGRGKGDIWVYEEGKDMYIRDSSTDVTRKLTWIHLKEGKKHIYICDRVLITNVTWDYLNSRGMIYGTHTTIDGRTYKLRVPTGQNPLIGASEWDSIIKNTANIAGLPKPNTEDLNNTNSYFQLDGEHNQLWNWWGVYSMCQEQTHNSTGKVTRGFSSVGNIVGYEPSTSSLGLGWRPVLEYTETNPPEKPTIVKPVAPDSNKPYVNETSSVVVETLYNGVDSPFKEMKIEVTDFGGGGEVIQKITTPTLRTGITDLKPQVQYQLEIKHVDQSGSISPSSYSYIILGEYGKYKLSEPVTAVRYSKASTYGEPQTLLMGDRKFPETEASKVRLVPETMNSLVIENAVTNNNIIKVNQPTKTINIGDKINVKNEPRSILGIEKLDKFEYTIKVLSKAKSTSPNYKYGASQGNNTTVHDNKIYVSYTSEGNYFTILEFDLETHNQRILYSTVTSSPAVDTCIVSEGQHMFAVIVTEEQCRIWHFQNYSSNADLGYQFSPKTGFKFDSIDIDMDLETSTVAITYNEVSNSGISANLYAQEFAILSSGKIEPTYLNTLRTNSPSVDTTDVYIAKYKRGALALYGAFYVTKVSTTLMTEHVEWVAGTKNSTAKAGTYMTGNLGASKISLFSYEYNGTYYVRC